MESTGEKRSINDKLDQLGAFPIIEENKVNIRDAIEENKTPAEKDFMNQNLIAVAEKVTELLGKMGTQLEKEDTQRENLISFFEKFTCVITIGPLVLIGIIYYETKGSVGICTQLAALAAFINIPVSSIGVLKCIAEGLFNDTYRKTMPNMITKITNALANYNMAYIRGGKMKIKNRGEEN